MSDRALAPLDPGLLVADRYEVLRLLDEPGGTQRYEAVARSGAGAPVLGGEHVWLHVLGAVADPAVVRRIERGAKALRSSRETHLIDVIDVVAHAGQCIAVSEPVAAPSLAQILRDRGALPTAAAIESAMQICAALAAAQQVGVEARAVGAADVFVQGVGLSAEEGAPTDWDRPESRVLLHRLPSNGVALGAGDEELGLVGAVGLLLWAMLAGEWPAAAASNGGSVRCDVQSLRALREIWEAPPLPSDVEAVVEELAAGRSTTLQSVTATLRAVSASLLEQARSSMPGEHEGVAAPPTERELDPLAPPTDREPVAHEISSELAPGTRSPSTDAAPVETAPSPGQPLARRDGEPPGAAGGALDAGHGAEPAVGTTMKSHRDAALELPPAEQPDVQVREAAPASDSTRITRPAALSGGARPTAWDDDRGEQRIWLVVAVLAAALGIALGIALGVR